MNKTKKQTQKKEYLVTVPVKATGTQTFSVRAIDAEFAITLVGDGHGTFVGESFDVQDFILDRARVEENV